MYFNRFDYSKIPSETLGALDRYVNKRIEIGGFLYAVLCNNLKGAVALADDNNIRIIPQLVMYIYNEIPSECWGSNDKVNKWLS